MWQKIKSATYQRFAKLRNAVNAFASDAMDGRPWLKYAGVGLGIYLFLAMVWGMYITYEPHAFSVYGIAEERINQNATSQRAEQDIERPKPVTGVVTTSTLIEVVDVVLNKPGGYLSNDVTPPGVWLDNIPNWEKGAIIQVRHLAKAMFEEFSRSQSQSIEEPALASAASRFNFYHKSWILPRTESQYEEGIRFLEDYLTRLQDESEQQAQFYARADNLNYWLKTVESSLGSLSQRLSASVGQRRINTDLAGDSAAAQSTATPRELEVKTPWVDLDDVFYEARGGTWALMHFLKAVEIDFADVLENKNARISLKQIVRELEGAQQPVSSPVILNGSGFGVFANHSLVMANYISRANAAIIDLRELLSRG